MGLRIYFEKQGVRVAENMLLQSPVVTICTASLTFNNSTFCPQSVFVCFVWVSEQTAIISLHSINWLVCITEIQSVYCAVRTECLNTIQVNLRFQPRGSVHLNFGLLARSRYASGRSCSRPNRPRFSVAFLGSGVNAELSPKVRVLLLMQPSPTLTATFSYLILTSRKQ